MRSTIVMISTTTIPLSMNPINLFSQEIWKTQHKNTNIELQKYRKMEKYEKINSKIQKNQTLPHCTFLFPPNFRHHLRAARLIKAREFSVKKSSWYFRQDIFWTIFVYCFFCVISHRWYLSSRCPFLHRTRKFFVLFAKLRSFGCTLTGLNNAMVSQNWQISGM